MLRKVHFVLLAVEKKTGRYWPIGHGARIISGTNEAECKKLCGRQLITEDVGPFRVMGTEPFPKSLPDSLQPWDDIDTHGRQQL